MKYGSVLEEAAHASLLELPGFNAFVNTGPPIPNISF